MPGISTISTAAIKLTAVASSSLTNVIDKLSGLLKNKLASAFKSPPSKGAIQSTRKLRDSLVDASLSASGNAKSMIRLRDATEKFKKTTSKAQKAEKKFAKAKENVGKATNKLTKQSNLIRQKAARSLSKLAEARGKALFKQSEAKKEDASKKKRLAELIQMYGRSSQKVQNYRRAMHLGAVKVAKQEKKLTSIRKKETKLTSKLANVEKTRKNLVADANKKVTESSKELARARMKIKKSFVDIGDGIAKELANWTIAGVVFGVVTMAAFALAGAMAYMGGKLEFAMAEVATMLDKASLPLLDEMEHDVVNLSNAFGLAAQDVSHALYQILSAQIAVSESTNVLEVSLEAAVAGFTTASVAADAITTILNAYGMAATEARSVSDVLFTTVRQGKTTFDQLASQIGRVAGQLGIAEISMEEMSASIATMTQAGIKSSVTMTSLTAIMRNLLSPSSKASAMAMEEFGITLGAAGLEANGLVGTFKALENATAEQLRTIFASQRAFRGASAVAGNLRNLLLALAAAEQSEGATAEAAARVKKTMIFQSKRLVTSFGNLIKVLGKSAGLTDKLRQSMESGADAMEKWADKVEETGGGFGVLATKALTYGLAIVGLTGVVLSLGGAIGKLGAMIPIVGSAITGAAAALTSGAGIIAALTALVPAIAAVVLVASVVHTATIAFTDWREEMKWTEVLLHTMLNPLSIFGFAIRNLRKYLEKFEPVVERTESGLTKFRDRLVEIANKGEQAISSVDSLSESFFQMDEPEKLSFEGISRAIEMVDMLQETGADITIPDLFDNDAEERVRGILQAQMREVIKAREAAARVNANVLVQQLQAQRGRTQFLISAEVKHKKIQKAIEQEAKLESQVRSQLERINNLEELRNKVGKDNIDVARDMRGVQEKLNDLQKGRLLTGKDAKQQLQSMGEIIGRQADSWDTIVGVYDEYLGFQEESVGFGSNEVMLLKERAELFSGHLSTQKDILGVIEKAQGRDEAIVRHMRRLLSIEEDLYHARSRRLEQLVKAEALIKRLEERKVKWGEFGDLVDVTDRYITMLEKSGNISKKRSEMLKEQVSHLGKMSELRSELNEVQQRITKLGTKDNTHARAAVGILERRAKVIRTILGLMQKEGAILEKNAEKQKQAIGSIGAELERFTRGGMIGPVSVEFADEDDYNRQIADNTKDAADKADDAVTQLERINEGIENLSRGSGVPVYGP